MPSIIVRPVATADLPAITAIYADAVLTNTATFEVDPPGLAEMESRVETMIKAGYPCLVADSEGKTVGFAYAAAYRTRIGYRHTVEDSIYLAADARGQGIGGALLRELISRCERAGFRQMVAVIGDSANQASIRLHTAAGFRPAGTLADVGFKFGRWVDTVLMQRPLGQGASSPPGR
jgi:phosphinothricin acetyltransferase